ncbi:MAG: MMPL family transporter [Deltaproteobacteria bacterium]|nr:MMPL family transporter [Candidatus Zymogenaceae bacterium]
MIETFFKKLARVVYRYDLAVLAIAVLITLFSLVGIRRITFISNVVDMLPSSIGAVRDYSEAIEQIKTIDYLVVVVSCPDSDRLSRFGDVFAQRIAETGMVSDIRYKITRQDKDYILNTYMKKVFLYLDDDDFAAVKERLGPSNVEKAIEMDRRIVLSPDASAAYELITADPLGLLSVLKNRLFSGIGGITIDNTFGYFLTKDGKSLLILAKPNKNPSEIAYTEGLFKRFGQIEQDIKADKEFSDVTVEYTGNHAVVYYDLKTIKRDIKVTALFASLVVLLLFFLTFRRLSFLAFVALSLNIGVIWTTGLIGFTLGHITIVTAVYAAILNGLGVDFSLHFYNRFLEEKDREKNLGRVIETTFSRVGPAVFNGAITTIFAFFAMCFSQFRGLVELGLIGGFGILMILITSFTVLPALLVRYIKIRGENFSYPPVVSLGTERIGHFVVKNRRIIVISALLITIVMGYTASRISFESDINKAKPKNNPAIMVKERMQQGIGTNFFPVIVSATGTDLNMLLALTEEAQGILKSHPDIALVEGPSAYLPSLKRQEENLTRLKDIDLEKSRARLHESLIRNGFRPEKFQSFEDTLAEFSRGTVSPIMYDDLSGTAVADLIGLYIQKEKDTWYVSIFAYPRPGKWDNDIDRGIIKKIKEKSPLLRIASFSLVVAEMRKSIIHDFYLTIIIASLAVFIIILFLMRDIKAVLYCMTALGMGVVWMLGLIGLLGLNLDFANITVTPMVIGLGIDYSVHIYYRYKEKDQGGVVSAISHTGRAILMTSLTTIAGYGSLFLARYTPMNSIGYLSVLGIICCLATTFIVMPAFLAIEESRKKRSP